MGLSIRHKLAISVAGTTVALFSTEALILSRSKSTPGRVATGFLAFLGCATAAYSAWSLQEGTDKGEDDENDDDEEELEVAEKKRGKTESSNKATEEIQAPKKKKKKNNAMRGFFDRPKKSKKRPELELKRDSSDIPRVATPKKSEAPIVGDSIDLPPVEQEPSVKQAPGPADYLAKMLQDQTSINARLAHEIMIDGTYALDPLQGLQDDPLQKVLKDQMSKQYWDDFSAKILAGDLSQVKAEMESVIQHILEIWPDRHRVQVKSELEAIMDPAFLTQRVEGGAFDGVQLFNMIKYIVERQILKLDSASHDEGTKVWLANVEQKLTGDAEIQPAQILPEIFQWILEKLEEIKFATSNYQISLLVPTIIENGAEYERERFQKMVKDGEALNPPVDQLRAAKVWFAEARELASAYDLDPKEDVSGVIKVGVMAMVGNSVPATRITCLKPAVAATTSEGGSMRQKEKEAIIFPETLAWDASRIETFQSEVQLVVIVSETLLMCKEFLSKEMFVTVRSDEVQDMKTLMTQLLRKPRPTMDIIVNGICAKVEDIIKPEAAKNAAGSPSKEAELRGKAEAAPKGIKDLGAKLRDAIDKGS